MYALVSKNFPATIIILQESVDFSASDIANCQIGFVFAKYLLNKYCVKYNSILVFSGPCFFFLYTENCWPVTAEKKKVKHLKFTMNAPDKDFKKSGTNNKVFD